MSDDALIILIVYLWMGLFCVTLFFPPDKKMSHRILRATVIVLLWPLYALFTDHTDGDLD